MARHGHRWLLDRAQTAISEKAADVARCYLRVEQLEDRYVFDTTAAAVTDPTLTVTTVINTGITQPIGIVFLAANDFFVLEKASGQVKRVTNGVLQPTPALDLAVNSNSERGLLSMALHPNFPTTPFVYIRWTESSTGADNTVATSVPTLGNRVDRYTWNGTTLTFDRSIIALRALQTDNIAVTGHEGTTNANPAGNHNGGVIKFGPDGKLYIFMGDLGRRGWMQNLANGPFLTAPLVDDTFGGPEPDNAHFTGVVIRLNDDGTTPTDNPFFAYGATVGGEAGANIQKIYSYGHRNGFGMAFDPQSGALWVTENADDAYSELNRVVPGMNGGWVQFAGPVSRLADFKLIETTQFTSALQQIRFPPTRIAYTPALAQSRLMMMPGATYVDPELSWRYEIGPAGTAFVSGNTLGAAYNGTLWMGSARSNQQVNNNGGSLYRIKITSDRLHVDTSDDPRLADRVADNLFSATKFEGTESETLKIGSGFGITPDIEQGPDGNLYVVSNTDNAIYRISRVGGPGGAPLPIDPIDDEPQQPDPNAESLITVTAGNTSLSRNQSAGIAPMALWSAMGTAMGTTSSPSTVDTTATTMTSTTQPTNNTMPDFAVAIDASLPLSPTSDVQQSDELTVRVQPSMDASPDQTSLPTDLVIDELDSDWQPLHGVMV